jgi:hypothetical protein
MKEAVRAKRLPRVEGEALLLAGLQAGIVSEDEARLWRAADVARRDAIQVDAFGPTHENTNTAPI